MYQQGGKDVLLSKTLSWILRHGAIKEGFSISADGYVPISQILSYKNLKGKYSIDDIQRVTDRNDKQRFTIRCNDNGTLEIKANQGHTLGVVNDLHLTPICNCNDVENVIHGTYLKNWNKIKRTGLNRMKREHIHFTSSIDKNKVISGIRNNVELLIYINLEKALGDGIKFYLSPNLVILSPGNSDGTIPTQYFSQVICLKDMMADADFCSLCNIKLTNKAARDAHFIGRKHQLAVHNEHISNKKEKCGVFISGLPNLVSKEQITTFLNEFGPTKDVFIGDGNRFALVEFCEEATAQSLIKKQKLSFMGKLLYVKPRKRREQANEVKEKGELDYEAINATLAGLPFNEQLNKLMEHLQPNQTYQLQAYRSLCEDLQLSLQQIFKEGCFVYPFGSTVTGLSFKNSDVDVYVEVMKSGEGEPTSQCCIKKARNALPKCKAFTQVLAIPKAKTPIVKCVHMATQISCDFNFKNMLGVCNTYLVKHYMSLSPQIRKAAIIIKYWANAHELHGNSSKFSNYALMIMLIFYLQQEPICCESVFNMQKAPRSQNVQGGWNGGFLPSVLFHTALAQKSIIEILEGFFRYYSQFNYSLYVICPYLGKMVPKADFLSPDILSNDFVTYKVNLVHMLPLLVDTAICVQDPFEHNHNLTKGVSGRIADDFKLFCKHAAQILKEIGENQGPLYKLFTCEPMDERFKWNENSCEFLLTMGQSLKYLEKKVAKETENRSDAIKVLWYEMVNEFVINILAKVLKCDITVKTDKKESVGDGILDSVSLHCKAMQNLWESRRAIRRDIDLNNSATNLEKEIQVTNYICDVLCKNVTLPDPIVEFTITLSARDTPMQVEFLIVKHSSMKGCFKSICIFLATRLPHWLNAYEREMNESLNKTIDLTKS